MPPLDRLTPLILTFNEAPNICRTLENLTWAERVVVVDSGSDDGTQRLAAAFSNTDLIERDFDTHARQWNFGVDRVQTEWTLALDADFQVPPEFVKEITEIPGATSKNGFFAELDYRVLGSRLSRTLVPPIQVLFRTSKAVFEDDGHTQKVRVEGPSGRLESRILHDDRKPLERWLRNQYRYARREAEKLTSTPASELTLPDRIRRTRILGPPAVLIYCLFGKGLILEGWPGWYYTFERTTAEFILSLALLREAN